MNPRQPSNVNDSLLIPIKNLVDTINRHCPIVNDVAQYSRQTDKPNRTHMWTVSEHFLSLK